MGEFAGCGVWTPDRGQDHPIEWADDVRIVRRRRAAAGDELLVTLRAHRRRYQGRLAEGDRDIFSGTLRSAGRREVTITRGLWFAHASGRVAFQAKWREGHRGLLFTFHALLDVPEDASSKEPTP